MQSHLLPPSILSLILVLVFHVTTCSSQGDDFPFTECAPLRYNCGGTDYSIRYPFSVEGRSPICAFPGYSLICPGNTSLVIDMESVSYDVKMLDYDNSILTIARRDFQNQSCPSSNTTVQYWFFNHTEQVRNLTLFYNCTTADVPSGFHRLPCLSGDNNKHAYFTIQTELGESLPPPPDSLANCGNTSVISIPLSEVERLEEDQSVYAEVLRGGFNVTWNMGRTWCKKCVRSGGRCGFDESILGEPTCYCRDGLHMSECPSGSNNSKKKKIIVGAFMGVVCFFLGFLIFFVFPKAISLGNPIFLWKKNVKDAHNVEAFLKNNGSFGPRRYQYSDLKKITNCFKDKLGQGGYGSVFKGKLFDDRLVAVKVLDQSKGSGEEFINEVASIGRTYHVNVVTLLGFCSDGSKRALIYEFMPNGSLERFIYTKKPRRTNPLGWQKICEIALGIARGLQYLHRGCSTRILHFDIKPHNILLDQDFCPKIADFGLAKLCPMKDSVMSMFGARGTFGYIAPEVYCRNFGGVSSKSDVYSYGMMVLEMVGGRRNIDVEVENTSEIYFPQWIYKRLDPLGDLGLEEIETEAEEGIARKMILVGLWCIQTDPRNRPSMGRVVEMLEGNLESLPMPPTPFLSSPTRPN